jgi:hypothetical protein
MKGSMNMTYKRSRAIAALAIVVIVAVCVAACGSSSSTSSSASSSSSSTSAAASAGGTASRAKLATCLKQHGVTLPTRPAGGGYGPPSGSGNGNGNGNGGSGNGNGNGNSGNGNGNGNGNGGSGNGIGNSGSGNGNGNGRGFGAGGGRFNNPKFRAAFKACGATAGFRGRRGNFRPSSATITKFAACVKQHGYTLPKPNLTGKGPVYPASIEHNAKFQSASRACQADLRPAGGGAPPGA